MAAFFGSIVGDFLGFLSGTARTLITRGPLAAAGRLLKKRALLAAVWPGMRTVGWLGEQLEPRVLGFLPAGLQDPARRLAAAFRVFSSLPFPLFGSFRRGVAYRDVSDVAEGWLAFFPEALVAGTQAHELTFGMGAAIQRGDWVEVLDILGDTMAEAKLEDPLAFLRGLSQIGQDLETIAGRPGAMTILTAILGEALTRINAGDIVDMKELLDFLFGYGREEGDREDEEDEEAEEGDGPPPTARPHAPPTPLVVGPGDLPPLPPITPPPPDVLEDLTEEPLPPPLILIDYEEKVAEKLALLLGNLLGGLAVAHGGVQAGTEIIPLIKRGVVSVEKLLRLTRGLLG